MPIYEYLCPECNRVFSFLVRSLNEQREPSCPKCGCEGLRKMLSTFSVTSAENASGSVSGDDSFDDPQVEREMTKLMSEAEGMDENDPRQLGQLMRRMSELSGSEIEPEMQEAMRRLEAGEDPEQIEEDLGGLLGETSEDGNRGGGAPSYDDGLYDL